MSDDIEDLIDSNCGDWKVRLIPWLPTPSKPSRRDMNLFGRNATQVRTLLDFLPTMSDDAAAFTYEMCSRATEPPGSLNTWEIAQMGAENVAHEDGRLDELEAAVDAIDYDTYGDVTEAAKIAMRGEAVSDLLTPGLYDELTELLNVGRTYDLLLAKPRYHDAALFESVTWWFANFSIVRPYNIVMAGRIAQCSEGAREVVFTLLNDGMNFSEAMAAAKRL